MTRSCRTGSPRHPPRRQRGPDRARQAGITAPAQVAELIDELRADAVALTHDPHDRILRADGHETLSVTVGKNR